MFVSDDVFLPVFRLIFPVENMHWIDLEGRSKCTDWMDNKNGHNGNIEDYKRKCERERNWECDRQTPLICQTSYCIYFYILIICLVVLIWFFFFFWSASKYTSRLSHLTTNYTIQYQMLIRYFFFFLFFCCTNIRDWISLPFLCSVLSTCINSWYAIYSNGYLNVNFHTVWMIIMNGTYFKNANLLFMIHDIT